MAYIPSPLAINLKFDDLIGVVKDIPVGSRTGTIYHVSNGTRFYLVRPAQKNTRLKRDYELERNTQIWVKEPGKPDFMPNHLRILLDLEMKRLHNPDSKAELLIAFDRVFYGDDPLEVARETKLRFPPELRPLDYDLCLEQLFLAEQTYGYHHRSKYDPKCLFLHGWVRTVLSGEVEIDKLLWSATKQGPRVKWTCQDDRNHKDYQREPKLLWYLKDSEQTTIE